MPGSLESEIPDNSHRLANGSLRNGTGRDESDIRPECQRPPDLIFDTVFKGSGTLCRSAITLDEDVQGVVGSRAAEYDLELSSNVRCQSIKHLGNPRREDVDASDMKHVVAPADDPESEACPSAGALPGTHNADQVPGAISDERLGLSVKVSEYQFAGFPCLHGDRPTRCWVNQLRQYYPMAQKMKIVGLITDRGKVA